MFSVVATNKVPLLDALLNVFNLLVWGEDHGSLKQRLIDQCFQLTSSKDHLRSVAVSVTAIINSLWVVCEAIILYVLILKPS